MFSWNAIQNGIGIIESGRDKRSGNSAKSCVIKSTQAAQLLKSMNERETVSGL